MDLLGEVAGSVGQIEDLEVEHREVEYKAKEDRMSERQFRVCDGGGCKIRLLGQRGGILATITVLELSQISEWWYYMKIQMKLFEKCIIDGMKWCGRVIGWHDLLRRYDRWYSN